MPELLIYNRPVRTFFELLGTKEDHISYAFGWCLSRSSKLLSLFLGKSLNKTISTEMAEATMIMLQVTEQKKGRTDFELILPNEFAVVVEAKKGWLLPDTVQLEKYSRRTAFNTAGLKRIVSLSECKPYYANCYLPKAINGIPVVHIGFSEVNKLIKSARQQTKSIHEKEILIQFSQYLNQVYTMQKLDSNFVFVVSLGAGFPENWKLSWIDIVKRENKYFHPVGKGWPKEPPNYIAFRYNGQLQSIHQIEEYEVSKNLSKSFPHLTPRGPDHEPHFIYKLGPAFKPTEVKPTGKGIYPNGRIYCMLDTLFTAKTISEAFLETKRRWEIMENQ